MPLYELVLEQRFREQQVINRFNFVGSGTPAAVTPSFALVSAFGAIPELGVFPPGSIVSALGALQTSDVAFVQVTARAVYIDEDFYGTPFPAGTNGGTAIVGSSLSPVTAYGLRSTRVKQSIGRGYKRFVGVSEGAVEAGGVLNTTARDLLDDLVAAMSATLSYDDEGNTLTFQPCIVQKEEYTTPSGKKAYRYYETEILQAEHLAIGIAWEQYAQTRSQVSRQYGRGS